MREINVKCFYLLRSIIIDYYLLAVFFGYLDFFAYLCCVKMM